MGRRLIGVTTFLTQRRYESNPVFSLQYNVDFICVFFSKGTEPVDGGSAFSVLFLFGQREKFLKQNESR